MSRSMTPSRTSGGLTATLATILVLLPACSDDQASGAEAEAATPSSSAPAPDSADPGADPENATRLSELAAEAPLAPGNYVLDVSSEHTDEPAVLIDVPSGYHSAGDGYEIVANEDDDSGLRHFGTWTVDEVATRPCDVSTTWVDPGPGVDDLADALASLPVWETTRPVPTTVGGHDAVFMEFNVPAELPAACDGEVPSSWHDHVGATQGISSGKTQLLWIVDVDGRRVMLVAGYFPGPEGPTARQVRELSTMAEGATFVEASDD